MINPLKFASAGAAVVAVVDVVGGIAVLALDIAEVITGTVTSRA